MLTVRNTYPAERHPLGDKTMLQPLPIPQLEYLDPFLLLHHHGPHRMKVGEELPFGPHPHRGIETVTVILSGEIAHRDNTGSERAIGPGGMQWMSAGSGILHSENTSSAFRQIGGELEILQLWINLPAKLKAAAPDYAGVQAADIPTLAVAEGVEARLLLGAWGNTQAALSHRFGVNLYTVAMQPGSSFTTEVPAGNEILFYVIRGDVSANDAVVDARTIAEFPTDGGTLTVTSPLEESLILFGYAPPLNEPVVSHGPFVMNTEAEIRQAYEDYRRGRFGTWAFN